MQTFKNSRGEATKKAPERSLTERATEGRERLRVAVGEGQILES